MLGRLAVEYEKLLFVARAGDLVSSHSLVLALVSSCLLFLV